MLDINVIKNKRIFKLTKDELNYLYRDLNMSQTDIGKLLNTDSSNVSRKFKKESIIADKGNEYISKKQLQTQIELTKEILVIEYPNNSITKIAKKFGVSYSFIYKKLNEFDIPIQKNGYFQTKYIDNITYDTLFDLYWNKKLSLFEIGTIFCADKNLIKRRLKEFKIKIRTKKEAFNLVEYKKKKSEIIKSIIGNEFKPVYNKESIPIIEEFGKKMGYNFIHAENGGEHLIDELFYWVDGYDYDKNVVVEYYEKAHKYKKEYDRNRISRIKQFLECKIFIIYENGIIEEK